ncbi:hypothetical protein KY314_05030 [Candidatus Woesearchaeota archaeon]|nr:hypothetical protein [Candidatus Woesearchaeota archaeon]
MKSKDERWVLYRTALELWGSKFQIMMLFEEIGELQQAISKYGRGKCTALNIAEEIADVEIMLEQMKILFVIDSQTEKAKEKKLLKLEELEQDWGNMEINYPEYLTMKRYLNRKIKGEIWSK